MCGIFGAVSLSGFFDGGDCAQFMRLTDLVDYRGPDDSGHIALSMKSNETENGTFDVFLGSRRLSILDLSSAGHQPMSDGDGCWIAFNGEIFNYLELRQELEAKGHQFHTGTDTEVILHVYAEYGPAGFDRMNGMWAFAIADQSKQQVVLSRDRFSMKPLYILEKPGTIFLSSEIKQLLPLLPKKEVNTEVMGAFLAQGLLDYSVDTFFRDIRRVPPKTNVIIRLQEKTVSYSRYWEPHIEDLHGSDENVAEHFRELLTSSIRLRLRSDVKTGVLLSGGLDSSAIAIIANQHALEQLRTYSIVSKDKRYSEDQFIDVLSRTAGIHNQKVLFESSDVLGDLDRVLHHQDEPFTNFSVLAQFRLMSAIKEQTDATVLLSGQGGDEVLLGYLKFFFFYVQQLLRHGNYTKAISELLASARRGTAVRQFALGEARRYLPGLNRYRDVIRPKQPLVPIAECRDLQERQRADIDAYSVPALAHYEDRNSMAHSLEVRQPFLDHRLVNLMVNVPTERKIKNGWMKYILRESLPELPAEIRWRRDKQPFTNPETVWLKRDLSGLVKSTFSKSKLSDMHILNDHAFLEYYGEFQNGRRIASADIARTFIAEMWARKFFA